jgi:hypothetical protein
MAGADPNRTTWMRIDRGVALFFIALGSVAAAAWMSTRAFVAGLPPEDAGFGKDAFALEMVALPLSLMAFGIAWPLLHFGLRDADLRKSLPLTVGAALVVTPSVAYAHPVLAPLAGLLAGGCAVLASRRWFPLAHSRRFIDAA